MNKMFLDGQIKTLQDKDFDFEVIGSTSQTDRMGDSISVDGWYLANYKKNPVVLWAHNNTLPPIAKAEKVWIDNKHLMIRGKFAPTPFAQEIRTLVENGFLNTVSVGFLPLLYDEKGNIEIEEKMYRRATEEEIKKSIYDNEYGMKFDKQELLEVSWVDVPALPQALVTARKEGLSLVVKELEKIDKEQELKNKIIKIENSIDSMGEAINVLEGVVKDISAKNIVPEESERSHAHEKTKRRITPELRLLRTAVKALEQLIIKEKANEKERIRTRS